MPQRFLRSYAHAAVFAIGVFSAGSHCVWAAQPAPAGADNAAAVTAASYKTLSPPRYPGDAISRHVQGVVYVRAQIRASGSVAGAHAYRIVPPSATLLGAAAVESVKQWKFNPATKNGIAVRGEVVIPFQYLLVADARNPPKFPKIDRPDGALDTITVAASKVR